MTDEKYMFVTDCADKKRTGRSAFNRRAHAGRGGRVKLPSDNLTKKEREAMNGECVSYRLNEPMDWGTFNAMPDDVQKMYILAIRKRFNVTEQRIAAMLGCSLATFYRKTAYLGCKCGKHRGKGHGGDIDGWNLWLAGQKIPEPEKTEKSEVDHPEETCRSFPPDQEETKPAQEYSLMWEHVSPTPISGNMTFQGNAGDVMQTVTGILGENTFARITITWETEVETVGREGILPANQAY